MADFIIDNPNLFTKQTVKEFVEENENELSDEQKSEFTEVLDSMA